MLGKVKTYWERFWGWTLVAVALLVGTVYYDTVSDYEAYIKCQTQLNQDFIDSLAARTTVSTASDASQSDVLLGISDLFLLPPTFDTKEQKRREAAFLVLLADYKKSVDKVAEVRAENPYPDISVNPC